MYNKMCSDVKIMYAYIHESPPPHIYIYRKEKRIIKKTYYKTLTHTTCTLYCDLFVKHAKFKTLKVKMYLICVSKLNCMSIKTF